MHANCTKHTGITGIAGTLPANVNLLTNFNTFNSMCGTIFAERERERERELETGTFSAHAHARNIKKYFRNLYTTTVFFLQNAAVFFMSHLNPAMPMR